MAQGEVIWSLIFLVLGFPFVVFTHELTHVIIGLISGSVVSFKPWPHRSGGSAVFGSVRATGHRFPKFSRFTYVAPLLKSLICLFLFTFHGILVFPPLLILAAYEYWEVYWWLVTYCVGSKEMDAQRWKNNV